MGVIDVPLVGSVRAAGLTEQQLEMELKKALAEFFINPHVETTVEAKLFFITGAVMAPGQYPIRGQLTLYDALFMAAGTRHDADLSRVRIVRISDEGNQVIKVDASPWNEVAMQVGIIFYITKYI